MAMIVNSGSGDPTPPSDMTPPKPAIEKIPLEVRYPQATQALQRIVHQMPFPDTLTDTLEHTASFVDQAGYLAQFATKQFKDLEKAYKLAHDQLDAANKENRKLQDEVSSDKSQIAGLVDENKAQKERNAALEKQLADRQAEANKREQDLTQKLQDAQKTISKDQAHDAADHKALEEAHTALVAEQAARAKLQSTLDSTEKLLASVQSQVTDLTRKLSNADLKISSLSGDLDAEKAQNKDLAASNDELKKKNSDLQSQLKDLQKTLDRTAEDLKDAQQERDDKDDIIEGLEKGMRATLKDRDSYKRALGELKERTDKTIKELQDKLAAGGGGAHTSKPVPAPWFTNIDAATQPGPIADTVTAVGKARPSADADFWTVGAWAGNINGTVGPALTTLFADVQKDWKVKGVTVFWRRTVLDMVTVRYANGQTRNVGQLMDPGVSQPAQSQDVADDDEITRVRLHSGIDPTWPRDFRQVVGLEFWTAKGVSFQAGFVDVSVHVVDEFAPPGYALKGFYGQTGRNLDRLGCLWG